MTAYIIRSALCMVLLYGLYILILRKEKLFCFNRYFLIFAVIFSLTIPFVAIPVEYSSSDPSVSILTALDNLTLPVAEKSPEAVTPHVSPAPVSAQTFQENRPVADRSGAAGKSEILLVIYLAGLMIMVARFFRNILVMHRLSRRSEKIDLNWYKIALLDNLASPFSFLRTVFLDKKDYLCHRIPANVLKHELEHVRQSHSYDVIFYEILNTVFWFNPVVYMFGKAARINHEYLADEAVVKSNADIETYSGELIDFVRHRTLVPFACGMGSSLIKDRLLMLNTDTSSKGGNVRILTALSLSVVLMTLLSLRPAPAVTNDDISKKKTLYGNDIVIEEVFFRDQDFRPLKAAFVIDGRVLASGDTVRIDPVQVKNISILTGKKAVRRYGRDAKGGAVEISTYGGGKRSVPDSLLFKPRWVLNMKLPKETVSIPLSNLYSFSMWTYPVFPNQDRIRRWRTIDIMTRDYFRIRGVVIRKNGDPFPGAKVSSTGNPSIATADKDGRFLLEDVSKDAVVTVSSEGCEPLYFRAVFKMDLKITLDENSEPDFNIEVKNNLERDFSGRWKLTKGPDGEPYKGVDMIYDILQYNSDSVQIRRTSITENGKEFKSKAIFEFNTINVKDADGLNNSEQTVICTVAPDGKSFSVTNVMKSKIGLFEDYSRRETFSLSDDGSQMRIKYLYTQEDGSEKVNEIPAWVFERVKDEG